MNAKYTNVVLTVIAVCLIFQVVHSLTQQPIPVVVQTQERPAAKPTTIDVRVVDVAKELPVAIQNQKSNETPKTPLEVKIVGVSADLPVTVQNQKGFEFPTDPIDINIKSVGGDTLRRVGAQVVLPVGVENTVDTKIVEPLFSVSGKLGRGVGVVLINR